MTHTLIIGAGAAGMMAAATIIEEGSGRVTLVEKNNKIGAKVIISGGGRCNVTTGYHDIKEILTKYPRGSKFLRYAMHTFPPNLVYEWFESHGVPLKTEADMRVFPKSDNGRHVVGVFEDIFRKKNAQLWLNTKVTNIKKDGTQFVCKTDNNGEHTFNHVIITTGGQAYRHTGSTGDGYAFAEELGHTITKLAPSLHSFICMEQWPKDLSGLSMDAHFVVKGGDKYLFSGPFLFTHKGTSGPSIFALSSLSAFEEFSQDTPMELRIDFLPQMPLDETLKNIENLLKDHPKKQLKNIAQKLIPNSLWLTALKQAGITDTYTGITLPKKLKNKLVDWLKGAPLRVIGRGQGDEFVTAGGVATKEFDSKTMESLICPGLYCAGEVLNIDGFTGGFNLQASWATGRVAGLAVGRK